MAAVDLPPSPKGRRRTSASFASAALGARARADFDFSMTTCKQRTMKEMEKHKVISGFFKDFYNSEAFDRFAHLFILYFAARLQRDWIQRQQQDKTKRHYGLDLAMHAVSAKLEELEHEQNLVLSEISPVYMEIIMKYSRYQQEQQDRNFFENLYAALIAVVSTACGFDSRSVVEEEMGVLFRSRHFNMYRRLNQPKRAVDTLTVTELHAIKNDTAHRSLHAKLISCLGERPKGLTVQVATVTHTPLLSKSLHTPEVTRSLQRDPEYRRAKEEEERAAAAAAAGGEAERPAAAAASSGQMQHLRLALDTSSPGVGVGGAYPYSPGPVTRALPPPDVPPGEPLPYPYSVMSSMTPKFRTEAPTPTARVAAHYKTGAYPPTPFTTRGGGGQHQQQVGGGFSTAVPPTPGAALTAAAAAAADQLQSSSQFDPSYNSPTPAAMREPRATGMTEISSASGLAARRASGRAARSTTEVPLPDALSHLLDKHHPLQQGGLPDAGGYPADEYFHHLTNIRRYVLFGPSLGHPSQAKGGGGGHGKATADHDAGSGSTRSGNASARSSIAGGGGPRGS